MYVPPDRIVWDFWFAPHRAGELYHLFHLDAPRDLPDPEELHFVTTIGHAVSDDLVNWRRVGTVLAAGEPGTWDDRAIWTGSIVSHAGKHFLFYAALSRADERPVQRIGVARSRDLVTWEPLPPLDTPREFGQLEVPQLVEIGGRWYLVFCTGDHSAERLARTGASGAWMGTHYMVADNLAGPFRLFDDAALLGDVAGSWYAGRIETGLGPEPLFFAWRRLDEQGRFVGGLSNPAVVHVASDGRLSINPAELWDDESGSSIAVASRG